MTRARSLIEQATQDTEIQWQGWGLNERLVNSCADLCYPSIKMRGEKNSSDISLDVVLNCNKKTSGCVTLPKYHIQISQQLQPPKKTFSEQLDFPAPERRTITGTQAEPIPADRRAHRRNEVPRRCPSGAQVPGLMTIRKEKTKEPPLGNWPTPLRLRSCLLREWMGSACLRIQSTKGVEGEVAQCDVCKYDKPLQYYSFSFGKPFRQEMITDPWYVNDRNAEISIWVNSCIFQPWNENLSVHIPIRTWKHYGAISWLLC